MTAPLRASALAPVAPEAEDRRLAETGSGPRVWIVVQTHAGQERLAKFHLQKQGFEVYLPMRLTRGRDGKGGVAPFFPRYLFVQVTAEVRRWQAIFSTIGVARVFCAGERPVGVKDKFIERIREKEIDGLLHVGVPLELDCPFKTQDPVLYGVIEGVFMERVDARRATILVSLLGRDSRVTVDLHELQAQSSAGK